MPGISSLGSSCSDNLCRLTLLSWNIEQRLRMWTDTLTMNCIYSAWQPPFSVRVGWLKGRWGRGGGGNMKEEHDARELENNTAASCICVSPF